MFSGASNKQALSRFLQNLDVRKQFRVGELGPLLGTRRPVKGRIMYDYQNHNFCVELPYRLSQRGSVLFHPLG